MPVFLFKHVCTFRIDVIRSALGSITAILCTVFSLFLAAPMSPIMEENPGSESEPASGGGGSSVTPGRLGGGAGMLAGGGEGSRGC